MKIKTWLLLSYFIVMVLPLISVYVLYGLVTSYHNDKKVEEYYEIYTEIQNTSILLEDPELYKPKSSKDHLEDITNEQLSIILYNQDGIILYTSNPTFGSQHVVTKELLFEKLYELNEGLRTVTYKQPVFNKNEIVGVYEIQVVREQLFDSIIRSGWIVTSLFITSFILIYLLMAWIVHRRLSRRLYGLMEEMSAFASGDAYVETETGKDEIGELKQHFYAMRKQIQAAQELIRLEQEEKEYMVAAISHDLKTPLTSIKAYAESLDTAKNLSEKDKEAYRKVIIDKADFMKQMLDDLIIHTLLQSQDYEMEFVIVDGEEFFDMLVSDYDPLCEENNIQLISMNTAVGQYEVNPKQFMRVADNLMMNAIQHTNRYGKIWIVVCSQASKIEPWLFDFVQQTYPFDFSRFAYFIVQNEGKGIKEENLRFLFDPLFQVDKARSKRGDANGTGLGLSITKQIIEKHGGTVQVFSKVNIGACFICSIPKKGVE